MSTHTEGTWIPEETFGDRLNLVRRRKGLTIKEAAMRCGLKEPTWSLWERDGSSPRDMATVVGLIQTYLGVDRNWLMWGGPLGGTSEATLSRFTWPVVADTAAA